MSSLHTLAYPKQHSYAYAMLQARCLNFSEKCRTLHLYRQGKTDFLPLFHCFLTFLKRLAQPCQEHQAPHWKDRREKIRNKTKKRPCLLKKKELWTKMRLWEQARANKYNTNSKPHTELIKVSFTSTSQLPPQLSFGSQNQPMVDLGLSQCPTVLQVQHRQYPIGHQVSTDVFTTCPEYSHSTMH